MRRVERQFASVKALARLERGEVEEAERHRLLQLVRVARADEDGGDMRLDGRRRAGQAREEPGGLPLLGRDARGSVAGGRGAQG